MGNKLLKQLRGVLLAESLFSGASSLSKVFNETENELDDIIKNIDKKVKQQSIQGGKYFKNGK